MNVGRIKALASLLRKRFFHSPGPPPPGGGGVRCPHRTLPHPPGPEPRAPNSVFFPGLVCRRVKLRAVYWVLKAELGGRLLPPQSLGAVAAPRQAAGLCWVCTAPSLSHPEAGAGVVGTGEEQWPPRWPQARPGLEVPLLPLPPAARRCFKKAPRRLINMVVSPFPRFDHSLWALVTALQDQQRPCSPG